MKETILDLHIHSKYSRACSKDLALPQIGAACARRGIAVAATGDFTHPKWFAHMQEELMEVRPGIYALKSSPGLGVHFVIGTEIASIKKHAGETRRVHHLLFAPSIEAAGKLNQKLIDRGINLGADGRPIIGMTSKDILALMLDVDERMVMIPAHAWTPWFGIFGSNGGYQSLEECFEDLTPHIFAIETGLSSDPAMNRRVSMLDDIALISNSDAHSTAKLGREANVMQFAREDDVTYDEIMRVLRGRDRKKFLYTIEFYPEEGKYHLDGHRLCQFVSTPEETERIQGICPICKKSLVIGVMNRVNALSDRNEAETARRASEHVPFRRLVPLPEIIGDALGVGPSAKQVKKQYDALVDRFGSEFDVLLHASVADLKENTSSDIALAIDRVRRGEVRVQPGYDGQFGVVKIFGDNERAKARQGTLLDIS